ncbi:MAG: sulfide/dihydroorotate dehydrogenase-like FAD/NAD-binding protein [Candidatus Muiribacteriota bacterium]
MEFNKIMKKEKLEDESVVFKIYNPEVASKSEAGNFIILIAREGSERIPLTVMDFTDETISILVQPVGFSTKEITLFEEGDNFSGILGPLGKKIEHKKYGKVLFIAGGIGIAPIIPQLKALKKAGNKNILIHGARTADLIVLEKKAAEYVDDYYICTDDGTKGEKGLVTDVGNNILSKEKVDKVITVGPLIMMKFVSILTKKYNIPTTASLNAIMLDGTGMCGSCRVEYDGEVKFSCIDGPDMDAHKVDFDRLIKRNSRFIEAEQQVKNEQL